jgi:pimeloyl-ACP methyl ester carboxylesterase
VTPFRRAAALLALACVLAACDALASASATTGPPTPTVTPKVAVSTPTATPSRPPQGVATPRPTRSATAPPVAAATATPAPTPRVLVGDGKWHTYTIQGHDMDIACPGKGRQPVILEHGIGYGVDSASWRTVMSAIATFAFVCRYDRPFTGRSEAAANGRSLATIASETRALLKAAKIPPPYILVGHSFGGITTRYYAAAYPGEVAGIVLVDGTHQRFLGEFTLASERLSEPKVIADAKRLGSLGDRPLAVLTRGFSAGARWQQAQKDLAKLSTNAKQVVATRSGHFIQTSQPDLVVSWVKRVLASARTGDDL